MFRGANLDPNDVHQNYHIDDEMEPGSFLKAELENTKFIDRWTGKECLGIVTVRAMEPGSLDTVETNLIVVAVDTWISLDENEVMLKLRCVNDV